MFPRGCTECVRMANMIYITSLSLDGYIEDETGAFDWVTSDRVFDFITELVRPVGTHLLGRRLYETMAFWAAPIDAYPSEQRDFARVWQSARTIVFSRTLADVAAPDTRIERNFDPGAIRKLKRESEHAIMIGGAELAALAIEADLVDECHLFLDPVIVGGGKPAFRPGLRRKLELAGTRRFDSGVIHAHYRLHA